MTEIWFLTAPSSKNVCRSLGLTQRRHLPDPLKSCPLGPTGPTVSCISAMILSHSHITLQFTFIWQLWYCHIHIWLSNLPSYDNYDIVTFTYDSSIYLHMTTMILSHSHMTPIYLHMTTMVLSHSHMTSIYLHITTMILSNSHITLQFTFIWQLWHCHIHI